MFVMGLYSTTSFSDALVFSQWSGSLSIGWCCLSIIAEIQCKDCGILPHIKIAGKDNPVADLLSRYYADDSTREINKIHLSESFPLSLNYIAKHQQSDQFPKKFSLLSPKDQRTMSFIKFKTVEGTELLFHKDVILIPSDIQHEVIDWIHINYVHPGMSRMNDIISSKFFLAQNA